VETADEIVRRTQSIFGSRLRGLFAFGSRIAGRPRPDSDLDVGVWLEGPLRRRDSWLPWIREFESADPVLDPTFLTTTSLDAKPS
jgi:predicted nucleotidyltransferase